jgi:predicted  nucleic acid-binding Zn-ribbon protein
MNDLAPRLAEFHRLMRELAAETERLNGVPEDMRALHDEYTAARAEIDALVAGAEDAARERRAREGAVADSQEKLKHFQQQVSRVRNQREYGALLTEIDTAKTSLRGLEDGALDILERAETTTRTLAERRESFAGLEERYAAAMAAWEAKKPSVAERVRALQADADRVRAELPRNIVAQYARVSERYKGEALTPIARTERAGGTILWHCASCNYQVRAQVAVEIRTHGVIVQCEGCRRFLVGADPGA